MKILILTLSLLSASAHAGSVSERPYCEPTPATELFVHETIEKPFCTGPQVTEEIKAELLAAAERTARTRCNGLLSLVKEPRYLGKSSCWSGGPTYHSVDATYKCEPI